MKSAARWLGLICSVLLALGVAELGFRVVWLKRLVLRAGIGDPHFHHRLAPSTDYHFWSGEFDVTVRTNRYGLRGRDPVMPKPPGTFRILMLGDSFTFGFPVRDEETFCARIEHGLRAQGYPVEVVNGGVSGYSPTLHYLSLRDQFLAFEPDLVVLWYDLGDLQEDAWFQKNLLLDKQGRIVRCDARYVNGRFSWKEWFGNHTALGKYYNTKVLTTIEKLRILGPVGYLRVIMRGERAKTAIARIKAAQRSADLAERDRFLLVRETSTPEIVAPYWALSHRYLLMIKALLDERRIPFAVGLYPYGMLVGPDQWAEGRGFWGFERGKTYSAQTLFSLFEGFSAEQRVPLINTFGSFQRAADSATLFYSQDGHMTPAGHDVLAGHALQDPALLALLPAPAATEAAGDLRRPSPGP